MPTKTKIETFSADEKAAMASAPRRRRPSRPPPRARPRSARRSPRCPSRTAHRAAAPRVDHRGRAASLTVRTYYGMPAYARNGKVVAFYKPAEKFKSRYATFGFEEEAHLDDGEMWPTSWALTKLPRPPRSRSSPWSRRPRAEYGTGREDTRMTTTLAVTSVKVLDQDEALDFYVNKLGPREGPGHQAGPVPLADGPLPRQSRGRDLPRGARPARPRRSHRGAASRADREGRDGLIVIHTDDARALYETLVERGVTDITQEPMEHFYGIDMGIRDPFGNAIRILQPAKPSKAKRAEAGATA